MNALTNSQWMQRRRDAVPRGVGQAHALFAERAENAELWDVEGRRYIDFTGGIAVLNTGHRHPTVMAAVQAQMERFTHTCFQVVAYDSYVEVAERLNALAPGDFAKKTLLLSSGSEALENAVKIARCHTGRSGVICFTGGYHGRTLMTLAMTGKIQPYKTGFGPFPAETFHALFPNPLHGISIEDAKASLAQLFRNDIEPGRVAAIVIEPVQGEGGFHVAPPEFLRHLREVCDTHGILLVADEVQTGAGRTGTWFAIEQSGVAPDLITTAKSLAGGFPLSAVVGRAEVMDAPGPGGLGGTYAGNPLACAAALAVMRAFDEEALLARSRQLGEQLMQRLRALQREHPRIADVRGLGAMVAFELFDDRGQPDAASTSALVARAAERGLLLLSCGSHGNVVRILVPITAAPALIEEGMAILQDCL
ncbi:4-aminobutyrate aminotransferase [Stenotrophomonas sp. Leaf70]|uniref:4-aminobutyrate--2-oxoglutarate transaminase n=1 Tax=Stenotrophomonas sp. Leaf70 TaxID=1736233 RepID=UPI0006FB3133|nr:4-aminobutyrate--2-oxoglutarate transaminase [Stenotrophomonas sp. Leaf70]KQO00512.1 4-aminobutyrate aminotransferase [Stenotrophomonas sp. Leaf70]